MKQVSKFAIPLVCLCALGRAQAPVQSGMRPPYSQNWNLSIERAIARDYLLDVRYVGNKGTYLPRFIEANPTIYGPGVNADNNNEMRQYTTCNSAGICNYGSVGLIPDDSNST